MPPQVKHMKRFLVPDDTDAPAIEAAVTRGHSLVFGPWAKLSVTFLDTFDWRLHNAGLVLTEEYGSRRVLVLHEPDSEPLVVSTSLTPKTAADLPESHIADTGGPLLGIRSLIPVGHTRVERRDGRIEDVEGNIVTRLRFERTEFSVTTGDGVPSTATTVTIEKPGCLHDRLAFDGAHRHPIHDLAEAAAIQGRAPGDYTSKLDLRLEARQTADTSLRTILTELFDTLVTNVPGTIDDLDTEFLHDLRVACRRTRSALTQLKGVLEPETIDPFKAEFKWLGGITGPLRDLDVFLLEMPAYRATLPNEVATDLKPLSSLIQTERSKAHRNVVRALRSTRFRQLVTHWRECIETATTVPGNTATATTGDLAASRITQATRRILKKGRKLGQDPPAEALHRLRIDAKKLRYLLEFFKSLYPEREIAARIRELKQLQDILGGFNDMEVQRDRLSACAEVLHADPSVGASTILTLGRLAGTLEQRQEAFRLAFHDAFTEFSSPSVRTAYDRLFGGKESR